MIEVQSLTKRFGDQTAIEDLSFTASPGVVTGFLGPNGAGKSTTLRLILGLDVPNSGEARVDGKAYQDLKAPLSEVGALLDARAIHGGRSARDHLEALAMTHGIGSGRVEEVISLVGLSEVADQRAGTFSLGMSQRLGIAGALLGDPGILIFDEPVNGLDAEGIHWIRTLLRRLAAEGRTVLLSSHLMSEMALTAERLIVIGRGRLIAATTVETMVDEASAGGAVHVLAPRADDLARSVERVDGVRVLADPGDPERIEVRGMSSVEIGELAAARGLVLHELTPQRVSLEDAYLQMTGESVRYRAGGASGGPDAHAVEAAA